MPMMELSDDEVELVLNYRIEQREKVFRILQGTECDHIWIHVDDYGGYPIYRCNKCGKEEME